jgi:hypothetical protein
MNSNTHTTHPPWEAKKTALIIDMLFSQKKALINQVINLNSEILPACDHH